MCTTPKTEEPGPEAAYHDYFRDRVLGLGDLLGNGTDDHEAPAMPG